MIHLFKLFQIIIILLYVFLVINLILGIMRNPGRVELSFLNRFVLKKRWSIVLLLITIFMSHQIHAIFWRATNWHPNNLTTENLVGTWQKGTDEIRLEKDGNAYYKFDHDEIRNSRFEPQKLVWNLNNNALRLCIKDGPEVFIGKIVIFDHKLMILDQNDEDQKWLRSLGFFKIK